MSFLNPVSEPVLRFKSTDAGAPQINYNVRTAGDVKAVLKACLVVGYGTTASAGWSIVNEVNHVAEFVSPSAAMSDYRLGIDDTSTSTTTWYYQYQDVRTNPAYNTPSKNMTQADKVHVDNGWQLLVTGRGIIFIELVQHTGVNKLSARLTYFSQVKSGVDATSSNNILFFNIGHQGAILRSDYFYLANYIHLSLGGYNGVLPFSATPFSLGSISYSLDISKVDIVSPIYLASVSKDLMLGQCVGVLQKVINKSVDLYGLSEIFIDGRTALSVCAGYATPSSAQVLSHARTFLIYTDWWEY